MEGKLQTSFIPKQPLVENKAKKAPASANVFAIIGWTIFLITVLLSIGVFVYEQYLTKSINSENVQLGNKIKSFDTSSVDHFTQLDARLQSANTLLNNHLAVSVLMDLVSSSTLQSVQFTSFNYTNDSGKISVALGGKAPDFASVALQSDTFSASPFLKNQLFSNLGVDMTGGVLFKFSATIDPSVLKYTAD